MHVSNVQLVDPETKKPATAGYRTDEDGQQEGPVLPGQR